VTLTRLLDVNLGLLKAEEFHSLELAERIWIERGCPSKGRELIDVLEMVLSACERDGIQYAPVLLLRKKELERGTWSPRNIPPSKDAGAAGPQDGSCPKCWGTGITTLPGGKHGTFCTCSAGEKLSGKPA
jgi:hypothetical protein